MKIAVLRIAGKRRMDTDIEDTLRMLNLPSKFSCSIIEGTPSSLGMVKKLKDHVTFGEIDDSTIALLKKREQKGKPFYSLHPPIGGFEKKGTKKSFKEGGALGNRGKKINDLIKRMV